jgi:peptidoglycan LD-endopeptidase CwlK
MRYHTRNVNYLNKLADATMAAAFKWYQYCVNNKIEILIYETIRTIEQQREYVRKGASQTMNSYHIVGQALDFVPIKSNGAEDWNGYRKEPWASAIRYAKSLGFEWGGDWIGFVDSPHLQWNHNGYGTDTFGGRTAGQKPLQSTGIGLATSKYPEGYGINLYNSGAKNALFTGHVIKNKVPYLIVEGVWYGGDENMLCLGWQKWAKQQHFNVQWFQAYSKYPTGYSINTYDGPNGNYVGRIDGSVPYVIYARKNGYIDIGQNRWVKEEHFDVR